MHQLLNFLLHLFVVGAGVVAATAIAFMLTLLLALWGLRSAWSRLTGRPVSPFAMRMDPREAFGAMMRRAPVREGSSRTPRADAAGGPRRGSANVTDVEPK